MDAGQAANQAPSPSAEDAPRRGSYRTRAEIPAALSRERDTAGNGWMRCWMRDLSTTGAAIEGTLELRAGDRLRLRFGKPHERLTFEATVLRVDAAARMFGVSFDGLGEREAEQLYRFVMELAQEYVQYRSRHLDWEVPTDPQPAPGGLSMRV
jgi:c-di-GMP-binding flagellar brake protein YcgR